MTLPPQTLDTTGPPTVPHAMGTLDDLAAALSIEFDGDRTFNLAFPGATDLTYPGLAGILTGQLLNNIGDPWEDGHGRNHTKAYERDVIDRLGQVFHAPAGRWGYVTTGSTEGTMHALDEASTVFPDAVVYTSCAAHYSVTKAARLLKLPLVLIRTDPTGRISIDDLHGELARRRHRPAAIVATAGTTISEAVDDVAAISALCDDLAVHRRRVHVDAALSGLPLALLPAHDRPGFDFDAGATSMVVSGHKFLSTLMPCAVLIYAHRPARVGGHVAYVGSSDTTITGSRSGHTPLLLWWALLSQGLDGHRRRAQAARDLADYTQDKLLSQGWPAQRSNPYGFTVTMAHPTNPLRQPWVLGGDRQNAHIITMPGIEKARIDEFLDDLADTHRTQKIPGSWGRRPASQDLQP